MPRPRRFLVVDAMTLAAATALGITGIRYVRIAPGYPWLWNPERGWSVEATLGRFLTAIALLLPGLAAWTVAVLASRCRAPRPSLLRIARQPGAVACGVALLVLTVETVGHAISLLIFEASRGYLGHSWMYGGFISGFTSWWHKKVLLTVLEPVGCAILAAWGVLWLSRCARPEPSWVDRIARTLGACWITAALVFWLNERLLHLSLPGVLSMLGTQAGRPGS